MAREAANQRYVVCLQTTCKRSDAWEETLYRASDRSCIVGKQITAKLWLWWCQSSALQVPEIGNDPTTRTIYRLIWRSDQLMRPTGSVHRIVMAEEKKQNMCTWSVVISVDIVLVYGQHKVGHKQPPFTFLLHRSSSYQALPFSALL